MSLARSGRWHLRHANPSNPLESAIREINFFTFSAGGAFLSWEQGREGGVREKSSKKNLVFWNGSGYLLTMRFSLTARVWNVKLTSFAVNRIVVRRWNPFRAFYKKEPRSGEILFGRGGKKRNLAKASRSRKKRIFYFFQKMKKRKPPSSAKWKLPFPEKEKGQRNFLSSFRKIYHPAPKLAPSTPLRRFAALIS